MDLSGDTQRMELIEHTSMSFENLMVAAVGRS